MSIGSRRLGWVPGIVLRTKVLIAPVPGPVCANAADAFIDGAESGVLEEVIVIGSRIPLAAQERAQDVKIFTRADIDRSGQTTLTDFLNTSPDVSLASTEKMFQNPF